MANAATEVIRPLRRVEYDQLVALGAFQDERVELLEGALIKMSPLGAQQVAETSLATDRGKKLRLYAACGVPEYWIVNLVDRCLEVHCEIDAGSYARVERFTRGDSLSPQSFPDLHVSVADFLK